MDDKPTDEAVAAPVRRRKRSVAFRAFKYILLALQPLIISLLILQYILILVYKNKVTESNEYIFFITGYLIGFIIAIISVIVGAIREIFALTLIGGVIYTLIAFVSCTDWWVCLTHFCVGCLAIWFSLRIKKEVQGDDI